MVAEVGSSVAMPLGVVASFGASTPRYSHVLMRMVAKVFRRWCGQLCAP